MSDSRVNLDPCVVVSYCLTADLDAAAVAAAIEMLSVDERQRQARFVMARDRRDFAVAHALLRTALSSYAPRPLHAWRFVDGPNGKPALAGELSPQHRLAFNLTHTDGLVACSVARDATVGIDAETTDRKTNVLGVARRFFAPAEVADLERLPDAARRLRFAEIWVLKEAYVKAIGTGVAHGRLATFAFSFDAAGSVRFAAQKDEVAIRWAFEMYSPSARHRMAVAIGGSAPTPVHVLRFGLTAEGFSPDPATAANP